MAFNDCQMVKSLVYLTTYRKNFRDVTIALITKMILYKYLLKTNLTTVFVNYNFVTN